MYILVNFKDIFVHSPSQNGPTSSQTELMTPSSSPQLGSPLHWELHQYDKYCGSIAPRFVPLGGCSRMFDDFESPGEIIVFPLQLVNVNPTRYKGTDDIPPDVLALWFASNFGPLLQCMSCTVY